MNEASCRSAHCGEAGGQRHTVEGEGGEEEGWTFAIDLSVVVVCC